MSTTIKNFANLQTACAAKRVVCERRGRKIEMTTPCGGTAAECETVAEAWDTLINDPTFSGLDSQVRWGNSALPGYGVNSPAMMEARAIKSIEHKVTPLPELTCDEEKRRGRLMAEWLGLKRDGIYWLTEVGTKTDIGVYRLMKRLVNEGK